MPDKPQVAATPFTRALRPILALLLMAAAVAGCGQPGTAVQADQWAKLNSGTGDISTACGFKLEGRAFPHQHPQIAKLESLALTGAEDLAGVLRHDQTDLFQGETVRATAESSLALLDQCGLHRARARLRAALAQ